MVYEEFVLLIFKLEYNALTLLTWQHFWLFYSITYFIIFKQICIDYLSFINIIASTLYSSSLKTYESNLNF